jgi:ABC-2 type transport system permease protein
MVAHLLSLRYRLMWNGMRRSTLTLVSTLLGAVWGLFILAGLVAGLFALSFSTPELIWMVGTLVGALTVLGWVLFPLLLRGMDQSVSVEKLRTFPIEPRRLVIALLVVALLGVPAVVTGVAALATALSWVREPAALIAAPFAGALGVLICVAASKAFESVGASLASGRRYREVMGVIIFIPLILLGPIIGFLGSSVRAVTDDLPRITAFVSWTPLGAPWSIPGDIALGRPLEALAKFAIALVTLVVLLLLWRHSLSVLLVSSPRANAGSGSRSTRSKGLGPFNWFPGTPTGAVAARTAVYWMRDPRYGGSLVVLPALAALAVFVSFTGNTWFLFLLGPIFAATLAITLCAEVSYDGTAFASHLSSRLSGVADRAGRVWTFAIISVPLVLLSTVIPLAATGRAADIPAMLGIGLGLLLTGFGVSSIASARFLMAVPAAGESPFKSPQGSAFSSQLGMFVTWAIVFALSLPELVLGTIALVTGQTTLGFVALLVGLALGSVLMVVGIRQGGALLDRRGPELLTSLRRARGA